MPEEIVYVDAQIDELVKVFEHLLDNALHYTPTGGRIVVQVAVVAPYLTITYRDTGIGIEKKDLPHIFDRFYRADKARATDTGGTGLGLAIVKKIIELHHGEIEVISEFHKGSTFKVRLPLTHDIL